MSTRAAGTADALVDQLEGPASSFEKVEAILTSPITYALAQALPAKPRYGRPRDFHPFMWIVYHALVNYVWGSARNVEGELADDYVWRFLRRIIRRQFPDRPDMWLAKRKKMRRWHYLHALRYLRDPETLELLKGVARGEAAKLARELGLFDPERISWTHPDPDQFLQSDGKVFSPRHSSRTGRRKNKRTGEIRRVRRDPDAKVHTVGGGHRVFGIKFVPVTARNADYRVWLDHEYVPQKGEGGEGGGAMRCFKRLHPLLPGIQGVNYDMAMRGVHIDEAMRQLGWLIVTGVHDTKDAKGDPIEWHIEDLQIELPDGRTVTISIYAREGAAGIREIDENGDPAFIPLRCIKTLRRGARAPWRFYNEYELPPEYAGLEIRVRLYGNEEDRAHGVNRAEHLRAIPPGSDDFKRLNARRNDAESVNRSIQDSLHAGRAHSVGHVAVDADLLGFGLGLNALSWHRHRKREAVQAAA